MTRLSRPQTQTDLAISPGEVLGKMLGHRSMTQTDLTRVLGLASPTYVNDLVRGRRRFSATAALRLEAALGQPEARYWLNLQRDYDLACQGPRIAIELDVIRRRGPGHDAEAGGDDRSQSAQVPPQS
jgi:addiction module HigA family antidote